MADEQSDVVAETEQDLAEQDQTFELPDRVGASPVPEFLAPTFGGGQPGRQRPPSKEYSTDREPKTLEDLYALYPRLGEGDWKLRIERTHPATYGGTSCSGVLGDVFDTISMDEFRNKFGGGKYSVSVMAPIEGEQGPSAYRRLKSVTFRLPGKPRFTGSENSDMSDHQSRHQYQYPNMQFYPTGDPPEVRIKELELEERRRESERKESERLRREAMQANRPPEALFESWSRTSQMTADELRETHRHAQAMMAEEIDRLRVEIRTKDDRINQVHQELVQARSDAANTAQRIETNAMRDQKERHEDEVRRMRDTYEESLRRMAEDHRKEIAQITDRHTEERRNYESMQAMERERIRDETKARIETLEKSQKREIDGLVRQYDSRVEDIKNASQREIEAMRERCDREVSAIRESSQTQSAFVRESFSTKETMVQAELERLRTIVAEKDRENEELRRKVYKPTHEALQEAQATARLTGMVLPDEVESRAEPSEASTVQQLFGLGRSLVENAPKVLEKIAEQRAEQMKHMQNVGGQHFVQQPPQRMPPGLPPAQARAQMQQAQIQQAQRQGQPRQVPYRPMAPARRPVPGLANEPGTGRPAGPPPSSIPLGGDMAPTDTPIPLGGRGMDMPATSPAPPGRPEPQPRASSADLGSIAPEKKAQKEFKPEQVGVLFDKLEQAIATGAVTADQFAKELVSQLGAEMSMDLLGRFQPNDLVEAIKQSPGGEATAIVTRDGRKYVEQVFAHAAGLVRQSYVQASQPQPPPAQPEHQLQPQPESPSEQQTSPPPVNTTPIETNHQDRIVEAVENTVNVEEDDEGEAAKSGEQEQAEPEDQGSDEDE